MKRIAALLICLLSLGCQHDETKQNARYLQVYKALSRDSCYVLFAGYQLIPRENYYYIVILEKPRLTLFPIYKGEKEVVISKTEADILRDSLKKYYPTSFMEDQVRVVARIGTLISIMKENSIESVMGWTPYPADSTGYFIDFWLSRDETLRYESHGVKTKYRKETIATKIDSSWVYLADKRIP
jgi:hypothetical protein